MSVTNNPSLALLSIVMSSVIQARQRPFFRTRQHGDKQTVREKEKKKKKKDTPRPADTFFHNELLRCFQH